MAANEKESESSRKVNPPAPKRIKKLDPTVVNRIAAGEVIVRPANALKEMMENCLDAGSTSIKVTVKDGGLKFIQIMDNGHGIAKDDLTLVCERFTTSKLEKFEDLREIQTYGFRGEALASISHIAHVNITSMNEDQKVAYKARYADGKIIPLKPGFAAEPKPCAGRIGTTITVEDLFYNVITRRKALKNPNQEFNRVVDVVTKYAIHNPSCGFSLKKHGQATAFINTQPNSTVVDNIKVLYGTETSRELIHVVKVDPGLQFEMEGYISNANYNRKKSEFILFINHRLVSSPTIKKAVESIYSTYIPKKTHPFVYLSLKMSPQNVDVNVHPTKKQVHFLREDTIIETIQNAFEEKLKGSNSSRTFYTSQISTNSSLGGTSTLTLSPTSSSSTSTSNASQRNVNNKRPLSAVDEDDLEFESFTPARSTTNNTTVPQKKMVRTDERMQTLDSFVSARTLASSGTSEPVSRSPVKKSSFPPAMLTSIQSLMDELDDSSHDSLCEVFRRHTFVGSVDEGHALIQHKTMLYLCKVKPLSRSGLYQEILRSFANFGKIRLTSPLPIFPLLMLVLDSDDSPWQEEDGPKEDIASFIVDMLVSKAEMLNEYFSIGIDSDGNLTSLPQIFENYVPCMDLLPCFVLNLGTDVTWNEEQPCFKSIAEVLAEFYAFDDRPETISRSTSSGTSSSGSSQDDKNEGRLWRIEHVLFPVLRKFVAPASVATDGSIVQIACLENLYKIFERC